MRHLIISREFPPAPYPPGGIGIYVANIARLMAEQGETVHILGQRWRGAPKQRESLLGGRLIVHRIGDNDLPADVGDRADRLMARELEGLRSSNFPEQWFAWHAAFLAERLIEEEEIEVIEGQEWEAPLYYLLLRRSLGIGSQRPVPCIVHLHSPSEIIRQYNGALDEPRPYAQMRRMEEFCIRMADALLCPSHYLERQARERFGLAPDRVKVIRLPAGFMPFVERSTQVWARGSICFVGRLEPRKGIIEWMEAAARIAQENPYVHFDFVGADVWDLRPTLVAKLPKKLRPRFRFHGARSRDQLPEVFARARAGVVPSRWENFPNVCIEAMSSGLPVIATRLGGMVELIEDGRSGWLAPETGVAGMVDGLAEALRRCLAASTEERASMGRSAAETVRQICDNERTVQQHIAFRLEVAQADCRPAAVTRPVTQGLREVQSGNLAESSGAAVVLRVDTLEKSEALLRSLDGQSPQAIAIICATAAKNSDQRQAAQLADRGAVVVFLHGQRGAEAWNAGFASLQGRKDYGFWLFLDEFDTLLPGCIAGMSALLDSRPDVGIVSMWTDRGKGRGPLDAPLSPDLVHQLIRNEVAPASAFRAEALGAVPPFRPGLPREYDIWDLANRTIADGWAAVTYPGVLARRDAPRPRLRWPDITAHRAIRAEVLAHLAEGMGPVALSLVDDYVRLPQAEPVDISVPETAPYQVLRYLAKLLRHPGQSSRALRKRSRRLLTAAGLLSGFRGGGAAP
jgi:glycogen(starch) synthase